MYKKLSSWPFLLLFAALLLAILIPILRAGYSNIAHATGDGNNTPQVTTANSVTVGQPFQLQIQGFEPLEPVQISWNGNGGQFLGTLNTDANGAVTNCASSSNCVVATEVPAGTYTLTAIGSKSRLQANTSVNATISLVVAPLNVGPGSTIQVIGAGFQAGENLAVYFQDAVANGTIAVNADSSGSFTQPLSLPKAYNPQTTYYVYVNNSQNVVLTKSLFSFATLSITPSVTKARPGKLITVSGQGFLANESISVGWGYQRFLWMNSSKVNADGSGSFRVTIPAPNVFGTIDVTLEAVGNSSNLKASSIITLVDVARTEIPERRRH